MKKFVCSAIAAAGACMTYADGFELVKNGEPAAVIVLDARPTRSAQLAAAELRAHIKAITGAQLTISSGDAAALRWLLPIYVGESPTTRLQGLVSARFAPHESLIRIRSDAVILIGKDDPDIGAIAYEKNGAWEGFLPRNPLKGPFYRLGTLYAVYDFLETYLGVRWYMPTEIGTVIPEKENITLSHDERKSRPWTNYRLPSKISWQLPGELVVRGQQHSGISEREANLFALRSRIGGEPYGITHSVTDYHIRFGEQHPDWFVGGHPGHEVQLRFGHHEVIAQLAEDAKQFFSYPFTMRRFGAGNTTGGIVSAGDFFAVAPKDNRDYGDDADIDPPLQAERRGPNFGSGEASNYIWNCVNEVAKITSESYPSCYITGLAYAAMFEPPEFPLELNVAVSVCMADSWTGYGLDVLRQWRRKVSRLFTWEYYIDRPEGFPRIRPRAIARYLDTLREMAIDGMFIEMPSLPGPHNSNPGLYHLNHYVTFRLLREGTVDIDMILDEYHRLFYGPAAIPMKLFWSTLEQADEQSQTTEYQEAPGSSHAKQWTLLASAQRMTTLRDAMAKAEQLAQEEPYRTRVQIVRDTALGGIEANLARYNEIEAAGVPTVSAPKVQERPVIDGKLEESFWSKTAATSSFVHLHNETPDIETVAYITFDKENLYIGFSCAEPFMDEQQLSQRVASAGVCTDDSVEFVIDVNRKLSDYLHVMMNANGLIWYRWVGRYRSPADFDFEPGLEGAAWRGDEGWSAEFSIPLQSLTDTVPGPTDEWGINFYRNRLPRARGWANPKRLLAWSPVYQLTYHSIERFGVLKFQGVE